MKMRLVIFFALLVVCKGGYPAAFPEVVAPSDGFGTLPEAPVDSYGPPQAPADSYGAPVKAPLDSYAPPTKVSINVEPVPEILSTPAPEPIATEIVAAAPAQSASFNFVSKLTAPPLVALGVAETSLKATPAVQQEILSAPLPEPFQLNIPGLIPPITSIPLPPIIPPVQVLPPAIFPPPQTPLPVPIPVQPAPVQPAPAPAPAPAPVPVPVPVQTLALESNPAPVPVTKITAQEISVPRVQTAFVPQGNFQIIVPSLTPFNYAPYFFHANTLPSTFFASHKILPQLAATEVLNLQPETTSAAVETSAVKTAQTLIEAPSTSYGTPILETLHKKK